MKVSADINSGRWFAVSTFEERLIPKDAGWCWDPDRRRWWTDSFDKASRLQQYWTPEAAIHAKEYRAKVATAETVAATAVVASRASDADIAIPCPAGHAYLPYQRGGVAWLRDHPRALLADEMGLGKTIQVLGAINLLPEIRRVLVCCPASLRLHWARKAAEWLVRDNSVAILHSGDPALIEDAEIVIVSYDTLGRDKGLSRNLCRPWDLVVLDEVHYAKNPKAQRTRAVLGDTRTGLAGVVTSAKRLWALTGTPIPNRPVEIQPVLAALHQAEFGNFFRFGKLYCGAHNNGFGWDFTGASNLDALQNRLRSTVMVRRLKEDVLTELPPKRRILTAIQPLENDAKAISSEIADYDARQAEIAKLEAIRQGAPDYAAAAAKLADLRQIEFSEMSAQRRRDALRKLPYALDHIRDLLDASSGKLVVWAHHTEVLEAVREKFRDVGAEIITGSTPADGRQAIADRFQTDVSCRLLAGSILAAGTGLTLTAADRAVFIELDWVPGNVAQAEDRIHRIGQRSSVTIEHLVLDGSLDARLVQALVAKQETIEAALDRQEAA